jgi:hypothetical protein
MVGTRVNPAGLFLMIILALTAALLVALPMLQQLPAVQISKPVQCHVPHWLDGNQVQLQEGLMIKDHATKHAAQQMNAWELQQMLHTGRCAASRKWCNGEKELYVCVDPVSGLIGGLLIVGDQIITGYAGSEGYWHGKVTEGDWGRCDGRSY